MKNWIKRLLNLKEKSSETKEKSSETKEEMIYITVSKEMLEKTVQEKLNRLNKRLFFLVEQEKISAQLANNIIESLTESSKIAIEELTGIPWKKYAFDICLLPVIPKGIINIELQMQMIEAGGKEIDESKCKCRIDKTSKFADPIIDSFGTDNKDFVYKGNDPKESDEFYVKHYGRTIISEYCEDSENIFNKIEVPKNPFWIYNVTFRSKEIGSSHSFEEIKNKILQAGRTLFTVECGISLILHNRIIEGPLRFYYSRFLLFNSYYKKEDNVIICERMPRLEDINFDISLFTFTRELDYLKSNSIIIKIPSFEKIYTAD